MIPAAMSVTPTTRPKTRAGERSCMMNLLRDELLSIPLFALGALADHPFERLARRKSRNGKRHPRSGRRGSDAARAAGRPARVRVALRPPRRGRLFARVPDRGTPGGGGGRRAGGAPLDLA